jgi:hypothetical protein
MLQWKILPRTLQKSFSLDYLKDPIIRVDKHYTRNDLVKSNRLSATLFVSSIIFS